MSTTLTDELRRLALHQDLPECAQAADEIERLRGLVEAAHKVWPKLIGATCSCGQWLTRTASSPPVRPGDGSFGDRGQQSPGRVPEVPKSEKAPAPPPKE